MAATVEAIEKNLWNHNVGGIHAMKEIITEAAIPIITSPGWPSIIAWPEIAAGLGTISVDSGTSKSAPAFSGAGG